MIADQTLADIVQAVRSIAPRADFVVILRDGDGVLTQSNLVPEQWAGLLDIVVHAARDAVSRRARRRGRPS